MRNLKKFLALVLAMMMTLSLMVTVNAATPTDFSDGDKITAAYKEAVDVLSALKVVKGDDRGFRPGETITRAEVSAILYRIVTGDVDDKNAELYKGANYFTDVTADRWYDGYVNYCANNGLVLGVGGGKFNPNAPVTGYEALVMILRAIGFNNPKEFSSDDWRLKASGYGRRYGITDNIAEARLAGPATREIVAEIMFKGILAPMVKYSPLTMYTTDLLVDAAKVNQAANATVYAKDVPNTLMYQTFKIVGKRFDVVNDMEAVGSDNYGRPSTLWVKDAATDTVDNGGKYIVNPVAADTVAAAKTNDPDSPGNALGADVAVGGSYVPATTPGATYKGVEKAALTINKTPVKTYKGTVVTECQFTTDVNNNVTIDKDDITEYLNGGKVAARAADLDINHTQEGTIGAAGRTTEVYKVNGKFIIVYVDTFLGAVTKVINRTFDTAGNHVMSDAELHVRVNDDITAVATTDEKDYNYKPGDLVLLNTHGFEEITTLPVAALQTSIPKVENDFKGTGATANDTWAIDEVGKPTSEDVTVKGTLGTKNHKTGIEATNGNNYMANVVYLANKAAATIDGTATGVTFYQGDGTTAIDATMTTVPSSSPYNFGHRMANAAINKSYTIYKDANGFVVGMTAAETGSDIGIVGGYEPVRIGAGKYAVEVTLFMADGTEKTVRMLKGASAADGTAPTDGTEPTHYLYFDGLNDAETNFSEANLEIKANVLVKIEAYTKDGATYYKPIETNEGAWKDYSDAVAADNDNVVTGVADTLTAAAIAYSPNPTNWGGAAVVVNNVDDNTKFIIAEVNWDYSMNEGNVGGYNDLELSVYTGFKNIPTIAGGRGNVEYQRIDNTVYVHPDELDNDLEYTVKRQPTYAVDDTYLVYATGVTYQSYSTYKALKNGEPVDLKVSNNNLTLVNNKIETAMAKATVALIRPSSTNSAGYVTDVDVINVAATTGGADRTHTIVAATTVDFDKTGVIHLSAVASHPTDPTDTTGVSFLTVSNDCVVKIVNLETGAYYNATLDSISQYESYAGSHDFVYELDQYGYVSTIYIID